MNGLQTTSIPFQMARWIGVSAAENASWADLTDGTQCAPLPLLRREFMIGKPIVGARLYVCGLGHYELRLNSRTVGEGVLEPGWTDYRKTCLYSTYDVLPFLKEGCNALGVMLGNGFYRVTGGRYAKFRGSFGDPKLLLQLELLYADGLTEIVASGDGWSIAPGPVVFSCIYGGEDYDATKEFPGWDQPGFVDDERWVPASLVEAPEGRLKMQAIPSNKIMRRFSPLNIHEPTPGKYVCDFGQNFSGWPQIRVTGTRGATVKLIPGELLGEDGTVSQKWTGSPTYFAYTLKGEGIEEWNPRFTYTGFRYIQIEGANVSAHHQQGSARGVSGYPELLHIEGHMIYPDVRTVGSFECSHPMLNRIHTIINEAILSNMKSVLTDCPHREKLCWLEQTHLMGPSIMYNYDVHALYRKIIDDMGDAQLENGLIPDIAPEFTVFQGGFRDAPEWGSAYIIASWYVYNWYRDRNLLHCHYDGMKKYIGYLSGRAEGHLLNHGLGDWCDVGENSIGGFPQNTPIGLTATAIYYYDVTLMREIAGILGKEHDAISFARLAEEILEAFHNRFFDKTAGTYGTGSQTSLAMPLSFGMVPEHLQEQTLRQLEQDIRMRGNSMTGGDVGFRYLLMALTRSDRAQIVADMLMRMEHPSYGYQVANGATTLTELWNGPTEGLSQNHFMLGHAEEWLYASLAGIRVAYDSAGDEWLEIRPQPVRGVEWVKAHHDSPKGRVEIHWNMTASGNLSVEVTIPKDLTARIALPAPSREHIFEGGRPIDETQHLSFLFTDTAGFQVVQAEAGHYTFMVMNY